MSSRVGAFSVHVLLIVAITCVGGPVAEEGRTSPGFTKLLSTMRSEELRQLAQRRYDELFDRDYMIARRALDFFHDVRAELVLMESLQHPNFGVKAYAAALMKDLAIEPAPRLVEYLAVELERTRPLPGGGSELGLFWMQYKANLVEMIAKLTGLDLRGLDPVEETDLPQIVARAKDWVAQREEEKN